MAEQLIRTSMLCERLGGMSKNTAMALMAQYGI